MNCWNCAKEIPDGASSCQFCEASQKDNPLAEIAAIEQQLARPDLSDAERDRLTKEMQEIQDSVTDMLEMMNPDILEQMRHLAMKYDTADDFAAAIFIGDCPSCGSSETQDCETVAGIESCTVGRCKSCGVVFCSDCQHVFADDKPTVAGPKCPSCGSLNTNFQEVANSDSPDLGFVTAVTCLDCDQKYCVFCGNPRSEEDDG
jgi:uncharacterized protein YbbK (DUF523 family)